VISHIVLFRPPTMPSAEDRRALYDALVSGIRQCPSVRGWRIGRRVLHGLPGYEQLMREDYEYALVLEFEDLEGLREYLTAPAHAQLGGLFSRASAALAYDYDWTAGVRP
jgi:hypothetical protein